MPRYDYKCQDCETVFELKHSVDYDHEKALEFPVIEVTVSDITLKKAVASMEANIDYKYQVVSDTGITYTREMFHCPKCKSVNIKKTIRSTPPVKYQGTGWASTEIPRKSSLEDIRI